MQTESEKILLHSGTGIMGMPLNKIPADKLVPAVHSMAVSLLTDPDEKYCIREYHLGK